MEPRELANSRGFESILDGNTDMVLYMNFEGTLDFTVWKVKSLYFFMKSERSKEMGNMGWFSCNLINALNLILMPFLFWNNSRATYVVKILQKVFVCFSPNFLFNILCDHGCLWKWCNTGTLVINRLQTFFGFCQVFHCI